MPFLPKSITVALGKTMQSWLYAPTRPGKTGHFLNKEKS